MDIIERLINVFSHWPPQVIDLLPTEPTGSVAPAPKKERPKPVTDEMRRWRLTQYYVASQSEHPGQMVVPVLRYDGVELGRATPAFFSSLSLEGTGILGNGKLVDVAGTYINVDPDLFQPVWDYHKRYLSKRAPGYSGLVVKDDRVTKAFAFKQVPSDAIGVGFGKDNGVPRTPWRTLAADIGRTPRDDPRYKGKGGLVPLGTDVYIKELDGVPLPDGTVHDGWCVVNDTGGGIFGAHFDVFVGYASNEKKVRVSDEAHVWFDKIGERVPTDYDYGLKDS